MGASAESAVPYIIPLLKDSSSFVRTLASQALGEIGESAKSAVPSLTLLLKDPDQGVRNSTEMALERLGVQL